MKLSIPFGDLFFAKKEDDSSKLSPAAESFVPYSNSTAPFGMIFNNGIPSMTPASSKDRSDIIRGITDDAIDENFPPDATEAAELEETEKFTAELAYLSLLEEKEERDRAKPFASVQKRWEVRRSKGLKGKPHPSVHSGARPGCHHFKPDIHITSLLPASSRLYHQQARDSGKTHVKPIVKMSKSAKPIRYRKPIQQPRKQN